MKRACLRLRRVDRARDRQSLRSVRAQAQPAEGGDVPVSHRGVAAAEQAGEGARRNLPGVRLDRPPWPHTTWSRSAVAARTIRRTSSLYARATTRSTRMPSATERTRRFVGCSRDAPSSNVWRCARAGSARQSARDAPPGARDRRERVHLGRLRFLPGALSSCVERVESPGSSVVLSAHACQRSRPCVSYLAPPDTAPYGAPSVAPSDRPVSPSRFVRTLRRDRAVCAVGTGGSRDASAGRRAAIGDRAE